MTQADRHKDGSANAPGQAVVYGRLIRVRGTVQGVGFRPTVYTLALRYNVRGSVLNDGDGVLIKAYADETTLDAFIESIKDNCPPLGQIESLSWTAMELDICNRESPVSNRLTQDNMRDDEPEQSELTGFTILESQSTTARTSIAADARTCGACLQDTLEPGNRRYRYPFTNCTHCGPRLSIIKKIPYDRLNTSMSSFEQCDDCLKEYLNPLDRRFHAQPNACPACGPAVTLVDMVGHKVDTSGEIDALAAASKLILAGKILAVKGIGGFHLACDATSEDAVKNLRKRKKRYQKPFAMMAKDIPTIARYCKIDQSEISLLTSAASPVVLLQRLETQDNDPAISEDVAPGQRTLGFMLPYTPLHHLLMQGMDCPIVLTSANLSDEPQCTDNDECIERMSGIADFALVHDRQIVNRIDDSVVRVIRHTESVVRRARGYAPAPLALPPGFANCPQILALGGELKNTFCLIKDDSAYLSQHMGDLANAPTYQDYLKNLDLYQKLLQAAPDIVVIDQHPEYLSSKYGRQLAADAVDTSFDLIATQHHHAHIVSCLAINQYPLAGERVLGVALDGLGYGEGQLWGCEFLLCDYGAYKRLATLKPVAMPGGTMAMHEPWRNTFAQISASMPWADFIEQYGTLRLTRFLQQKPIDTLAAIIKNGVNSPEASSAGRLFDAVAASCDICRETVSYEGEAAILLESIACKKELASTDKISSYPFGLSKTLSDLPCIDPALMWPALLGDLALNLPASVVSARFHKGFARAISGMVEHLHDKNSPYDFGTVVLSGGVFQNQILLQLVSEQLQSSGYKVLIHGKVPANDGGISLGQALIAAAIKRK